MTRVADGTDTPPRIVTRASPGAIVAPVGVWEQGSEPPAGT